jgi:hypothetical protein
VSSVPSRRATHYEGDGCDPPHALTPQQQLKDALTPCVMCPRDLPNELIGHAVRIAGFPFCIQHAEEAIQFLMFGVR